MLIIRTCVKGSGSDVAPQAPQTLCSTSVMANFWCGTQCLALHISSASPVAMWRCMRKRMFSWNYELFVNWCAFLRTFRREFAAIAKPDEIHDGRTPFIMISEPRNFQKWKNLLSSTLCLCTSRRISLNENTWDMYENTIEIRCENIQRNNGAPRSHYRPCITMFLLCVSTKLYRYYSADYVLTYIWTY